MRKWARLLALLTAVLLCIGLVALEAQVELKAIDVLPGAFGEALDGLDEGMILWCVDQAELALETLLYDFAQTTQVRGRDGYLQILQTTLLLPGEQPADATDVQREIWQVLYGDVA